MFLAEGLANPSARRRGRSWDSTASPAAPNGIRARPKRLRRLKANDDMEPHMNSNEIRRLIEEGALKVAPVRARSAADVPRVRAALRAAAR